MRYKLLHGLLAWVADKKRIGYSKHCNIALGNKMASGATICVCVLEGQYAQLSNLGFPISLVVSYSKVAFA